jgi:DNA repair protein RadD
VFYRVHRKHGAPDDAPRTMRVDYKVGWQDFKSEWVCFEHVGFARQKAVAWWKRRSPDTVPATAQEAVDLANCGALAVPTAITVRITAGDTFERVVDHELGLMPEPTAIDAAAAPSIADDAPDDDIPF